MEQGTLKDGEPHPIAHDAMAYVKGWMARQTLESFALFRESLASCSIEGNRMAEVCGSTIDRLINNQPVSDRYLLGLAWFIRNMEESKK